MLDRFLFEEPDSLRVLWESRERIRKIRLWAIHGVPGSYPAVIDNLSSALTAFDKEIKDELFQLYYSSKGTTND